MHLQFSLFVLLVPLLNQLLQMLVSFLLADDLVGVEHGQLWGFEALEKVGRVVVLREKAWTFKAQWILQLGASEVLLGLMLRFQNQSLYFIVPEEVLDELAIVGCLAAEHLNFTFDDHADFQLSIACKDLGVNLSQFNLAVFYAESVPGHLTQFHFVFG